MKINYRSISEVTVVVAYHPITHFQHVSQGKEAERVMQSLDDNCFYRHENGHRTFQKLQVHHIQYGTGKERSILNRDQYIASRRKK